MSTDLFHLVDRGVRADVYLADQAHAVLSVIGAHADQINQSSDGNRRLFRWLQFQAQNSVVMALGRMFDVPSRTYQTRCFLGLLAHIDATKAGLPSIQNRRNLFEAMRYAGFSEYSIGLLAESPDSAITTEILSFFRARMKDKEVQQGLRRAKSVRDKQLAHNEHDARIEAPTWQEVVDLITLAKKLLGVVGWAFLNTPYFLNGEYRQSSDARLVSLRVKRLISEIV